MGYEVLMATDKTVYLSLDLAYTSLFYQVFGSFNVCKGEFIQQVATEMSTVIDESFKFSKIRFVVLVQTLGVSKICQNANRVLCFH